MKNLSKSTNFKRFRAILATMALVFGVNVAISYADGLSTTSAPATDVEAQAKGAIGMQVGIADPRPYKGAIGMQVGIADPRPYKGAIGMQVGIADPRP